MGAGKEAVSTAAHSHTKHCSTLALQHTSTHDVYEIGQGSGGVKKGGWGRVEVQVVADSQS